MITVPDEVDAHRVRIGCDVLVACSPAESE
jgi:hypothetical protein